LGFTVLTQRYNRLFKILVILLCLHIITPFVSTNIRLFLCPLLHYISNMDYSRIYLKKIAIEIQLTDYEQSGTDKVMELIEHLECLKEELHKLIAISEEGAVAHNESLRHDVKIARELVPELENIIQLHIDSDKSMELEKILVEFAQKIRKCF
ncbi:MAG: hypothetical protein IJQ82_01625, partial [Selenomonadaceae bacterium]|nr:hypothetical protein [Selenomonadaceae bacterium]